MSNLTYHLEAYAIAGNNALRVLARMEADLKAYAAKEGANETRVKILTEQLNYLIDYVNAADNAMKASAEEIRGLQQESVSRSLYLSVSKRLKNLTAYINWLGYDRNVGEEFVRKC